MWQNSKTQTQRRTQHLKLWQNWKTLIVTKLKNSNCVKTFKKIKLRQNSKTQIVTKIQKLKLCQNSTTQRGIRYCWGLHQYWCKQYLYKYLLTFFLLDILLFHANRRICFCFYEYHTFSSNQKGRQPYLCQEFTYAWPISALVEPNQMILDILIDQLQ